MKVLYFSATGNCLNVAKKFGGELISIPEAVNNKISVFHDDVIGIISPVFWLSVPAYIRKFLEQTSFECEYFFGIMTYGDNMFGALHDLKTIKTANGRQFDYINSIKMTENYLPLYEIGNEIKKSEGFNTSEKLLEVYDEIKNRKNLSPKIRLFNRWMSNKFKKKHCMTLGPGEAANMSISDDCIKCEQCIRICPMNNISLVNGHITFGENCSDCLGCIQNCPKNAIHIKGEKSSLRYRNPSIAVHELEKH